LLLLRLEARVVPDLLRIERDLAGRLLALLE
jgi:hypothetical protein